MLNNGVFTRNGEPYTGIGYAIDSSYEVEYDNGEVVRSTYFHENNRKWHEGIHDGDRTEETWWYTNGEVHLKRNWISDSLRDGNGYVGFYNGQSRIESNWKNGMRHGKLTKWYEDGQLHYQKEFEHDKPSGEWAYWLEDGEVLCKTEFSSGTPVTTYVKLENADSVVITYFDNGGLESFTSYEGGIENGLYLEFWESNQMLRERGMMKAGLQAGEWIRWSEYGCNMLCSIPESEWYKNMVTSRGSYILGKEDGIWSLYMYKEKPSQKWSETTYQDGKRHGRYRMWGNNGELLNEKSYQHGKLHGTETVWDSKGEVRWKKEYADGVLTDSTGVE